MPEIFVLVVVPVHRDVPDYPSLQAIMQGFDGYLAQFATGLAATWPRGADAVRRATILRHATKFATWQSLDQDGVTNDTKVALITTWLDAV